MVQELFFEIQRKKQHIFCDVKENMAVSELKKIIEGILKISPSEQQLMKSADDQWVALDDRKTLTECGFTPANAKAQNPAIIALLMKGETVPVIDELSSPPPIPDSMRHDQQQES